MGALILVQHARDCREFAFEVKEPGVFPVQRGDYVIVETKNGTGIARASSPLIECEDINLVAKHFGAYFPLKQALRLIRKEDADMLLTEFGELRFRGPQLSHPDDSEDIPF